jgi:hypothetical protein
LPACTRIDISDAYAGRSTELEPKVRALARAIDIAVDHDHILLVVRAAPVREHPPA